MAKSKRLPMDMLPDSEFNSNQFGRFFVVSYKNAMNVEVEFFDTGFRTTARAEHIRAGRVKDKLFRSVYGVGFVGDGPHSPGNGSGGHNPAYKRWSEMLKRCYCPVYQNKKPFYVGCSVHHDWHNFQNFAQWYEENYPRDGKDYQLDKDILIDGNRVYGPDACLFVSLRDNAEKARAKNYKLISPDGNVVQVYNLSRFSEKNGLNRRCMSSVACGALKQHRGWRLAD